MKKIVVLLLSFSCAIAIALTIESSGFSNENYEALISTNVITKNEDNFAAIMEVLKHPRCMNCHPNDNVPKQGGDRHPHHFEMQRGKSDHGFVATKCSTCHQTENNNYSGVPGAPHWGLAPASMGWQGLSSREIAQSLLDKSKNGNRSYEDLIQHMTEDKLVLWAWEPGIDGEGNAREAPPISREAFAQAVREWFEGGAQIPDNQ